MARPWTGIAELDEVLGELRDTARRVIGDALVGVYLHGSFALGGADDESDCDFLVATSTAVDDDQLAALRLFHADLPHRPGYWNAHLEGAYAPVAELADLIALDRAWPYVGHGSDEVVLDRHCNTEVLRWTLREHPVVVDGPSPRTLVSRVSPATLRSAASRDLPKAIDAWAHHDCWDAWSQRYAVVTLPRMLRTLIIGDVVSKPAAVTWAMEVLDPRWRPPLEAALAQRGDRPWDAPVDPDLVHRTLDIVRYLGSVAEEHLPPQREAVVPT
jgi:hypothetical protein